MKASQDPEISIIAPAHNERENLRPLVEELKRVFDQLDRPYEILIVDDGSFDESGPVFDALLAEHQTLRMLRLRNTPPGRGHGQSAAFAAGFRAARGALVATLDADLQNDPSSFPEMVALLERDGLDFVQGDRSGTRQDNAVRKATSIVSKWLRRILLSDSINDCGCSLRVMRRDVALRFPMEFRGMHRYMPIMACEMGLKVKEVSVGHRSRVAGVAKYGIVNRALPGMFDVFAVRWMRARRRPFACDEMPRAAEPGTDSATQDTPPVREMQRS